MIPFNVFFSDLSFRRNFLSPKYWCEVLINRKGFLRSVLSQMVTQFWWKMTFYRRLHLSKDKIIDFCGFFTPTHDFDLSRLLFRNLNICLPNELISTDLKKPSSLALDVYTSTMIWPVSTMLLLTVNNPKVVLLGAETSS